MAALTIPSLIINKQKKETVVQVQKFYSIMSQAIKLSEIDNGSVKNWNVINNSFSLDDFAQNYLIKYLNIIKHCKMTENGCFASKTMYLWESAGNTCGSGPSFILADGSAFCIINWEQNVQPVFYFDINGTNPPNKFGKDTFMLNISDGGLTFWQDQAREKILERCSRGSTGDSCGKLMQLDGWEIKDDYPW